ncbi:MAG TPA: hypothetical protein VKK79_12800, partial [Candidatus Lokiarchaeia archaeon]|nr:hypothetical protein [Candidatus Lokiarchaeia archaeon]
SYIIFHRGENRTVIIWDSYYFAEKTTGGDLNGRELLASEFSPWRQFAVLKSFVASISELGLAHVLAAAAQSDVENNEKPQNIWLYFEKGEKLLRTLSGVAPVASTALVREWIIELVDIGYTDWLAPWVKEVMYNHFQLEWLLAAVWEPNSKDWCNAHTEQLAVLFSPEWVDQLRDPLPDEQVYYQNTWGFDPLADRIPIPGGYRYEGPEITPADSDLQEAVVSICARVDFHPFSPLLLLNPPEWVTESSEELGCISRRAVFRRDGRELEVDCPRSEFPFQLRLLSDYARRESAMRENEQWEEQQKSWQSPWSQFAALWEFVQEFARNNLRSMGALFPDEVELWGEKVVPNSFFNGLLTAADRIKLPGELPLAFWGMEKMMQYNNLSQYPASHPIPLPDTPDIVTLWGTPLLSCTNGTGESWWGRVLQPKPESPVQGDDRSLFNPLELEQFVGCIVDTQVLEEIALASPSAIVADLLGTANIAISRYIIQKGFLSPREVEVSGQVEEPPGSGQVGGIEGSLYAFWDNFRAAAWRVLDVNAERIN